MNGQFNLGQVSPVRYFFGIAVILGFVFAFIAPDDNDNKNIFVLLFHWQLQSLIPMAFLIFSHLLLHRAHLFNHLNPWLQVFFSGFLGVLLYSPIGLSLDTWIERERLGQGTWSIALASEIGNIGPPILATWIGINAPWIIGFRVVKIDDTFGMESQNEINVANFTQEKSADPAPSDDDVALPQAVKETASFLDLVPAILGQEIVYIQAELHYLKVVTSEGSSLILYNLKDAVKDLSARDGFQCHRSFWVSKNSICKLKKEGRQGKLILTNGESIPVSRNNISHVSQRLAASD